MDTSTRFDALWPAKWLIVVIAAVVVVGVYVFVNLQPVQYSAQASVRVTVPQTKNAARDSALASEELAAQYAQYATGSTVLAAAQTALGSTGLAGNVTAVPLNNYNVIAVNARGATPQLAADRANAVAAALVDYVKLVNSGVVETAYTRISGRLESVTAQITAVRADISRLQKRAAVAGRTGDLAQAELTRQQGLLSSLYNLQQGTLTTSTNDLVAGQPDLAVVDKPVAGAPDKHPALLYALVALVVALLVLSELVVLRARVRARSVSSRTTTIPERNAAAMPVPTWNERRIVEPGAPASRASSPSSDNGSA